MGLGLGALGGCGPVEFFSSTMVTVAHFRRTRGVDGTRNWFGGTAFMDVLPYLGILSCTRRCWPGSPRGGCAARSRAEYRAIANGARRFARSGLGWWDPTQEVSA
jgi:hypothetical protein